MKQEKHQFGFIFAQSPTSTINRQSIEKSCNDFIAEVTPYFAQACKIPEKEIISDFYFDKITAALFNSLLADLLCWALYKNKSELMFFRFHCSPHFFMIVGYNMKGS